MSELQDAKRRIKAIRATRHSTELEGSRSTNATRADQLAYARGNITSPSYAIACGAGTTFSNRVRVTPLAVERSNQTAPHYS